MKIPARLKHAMPLLVWVALYVGDAQAAPLNSSGLFDDILNRYNTAASGWAGVITDAASWLFWMLVTISMVWTFGMMALRKADIGEFFAELARFTIFTGFFWWLLTNAPHFASTIYASLRQVAGNATGLGNALSPSGIVDVGFEIFYKVMDQSSVWSPVDSMTGILMALAILIVLALIGVNMLLLLASGWMLAYAGIFFLGFGGSRWTSDIAINYYKTVLGIAAQLMAMVLLVGIGKTFLDDYYARMSAGVHLKEMAVMLIVCVILLALVNKIPPLIAGIITGSSIGGGGIGNFGAGAALGAAGMAAGAAVTGGAALAAGSIAAGASAGGGAQALMAAVQAGQANVSAGTDIMGGFQGMSDSAGSFADAAGYGSGSSAATAGNTPFAQAGGYSSSGGGQSMAAKGGGGQPQANQAAGSGTRAASGSGTDAAPTPQAVADGGADGGTDAAPGTQAQRGASSLTAATAGRIAVDAAANLAKGIGDVAKQKAASLGASANQRLRQTTGGKIADAIHARSHADHQPPLTFGGNSLGGAEEVDPIAEVAAFANRDSGKKGA